MDNKSLQILEYPKIIEKLEGYAAFSASRKLAHTLKPTNNYEMVMVRQSRTSEARKLLSEHADIGIKGARDIRASVNHTTRDGILELQDFLDIKATLESARDIRRFFLKFDKEYPQLFDIVSPLQPPVGLIDAINNVISEKAEIRDDASSALKKIRREIKTTHERLMRKLDQIITDPNNSRFIQEALITKRNGRYVIPLRAEHKGRMNSVVQDQSASGSTLFVEPLVVVDLNNAVVELELQEKEEIRRILAELSALVAENADQLSMIVRGLAFFDLTLMCAKYADDIDAIEPIFHTSTKVEEQSQQPVLKLLKARHPLIDPKAIVPIDIILENGTFSLVITGPNTGGKTVSLKTAGLLTLMALAGLHIPAQSGSELFVFKNVFADIGDEQSIEQSLSTFSGHITNIVKILKKSRWNTFVLLDELGAGTDPQEGSALARAILTFLVEKHAPNLIATHYPELKIFAHSKDGVMNASMEFDLKTLRPTYKLLHGLPGKSNALSIATQLGLDEAIVNSARNMLNPDELDAEGLLDEIHKQRDMAIQDRNTAELAKNDIEKLQEEWQTKMQEIDKTRIDILEEARKEADKEVNQLRTQLDQIKKKAKKTPGKKDDWKKIQKEIDEIEEKIQEPPERVVWEKQVARPLRSGDRVFIRSLNVDGYVYEISRDTIEVEVGKMRVKVSPADISRSKFSEKKPRQEQAEIGKTNIQLSQPQSPGLECHLRGMRVEDALPKLEIFIERAYSTGMPYVRIVHGKGTGTLRQVAREFLGRSPYIDRWEEAQQNEGGFGVTIAHMKN